MLSSINLDFKEIQSGNDRILSKKIKMQMPPRTLASLLSVTAAASVVVLSSCSSASLSLLGGDGIGFAEAFTFQGVVPSARRIRISRARTASASAQRRFDGLFHVVRAAAASAGDDGENEVEITIGQPIDGSADIIEVDEDQVVVHPAAAAAAAAASDGDAVSKAPRIEGEDDDEDADTTASTASSSSKASENEEPLVLEPVPPASHSLETSQNGPAGGTVTTLTVHLGAPGHPDPIVIQTCKVGRQAAGAVTLTRGDTVLYATAARDSQPKDSIDFLPLSVEHQERFSSAGLTSGSYNKRDGRVSIGCKLRMSCSSCVLELPRESPSAIAR